MGILGESITLSLALQDSQHIENVVWMFNTSIISKEQGEAATANQLTEFKDPHKNTLWVSNQDYSLKISQLRMEDAGPYHAYVCSNTRVAITKHFNLLVYGECLSRVPIIQFLFFFCLLSFEGCTAAYGDFRLGV